MKKYVDKTLALYCVVGVLNFVVCTAIMYTLYNLHICGEHIATLVNYGLGSLIWYYGCTKLVFPERKPTASMAVRFVVEVVVCYIISFYFLTPPICYALSGLSSLRERIGFLQHMTETEFAANCSMTIGVLVYAILNYFGQRYFVFRTCGERKKSVKTI